MAESRGDIPGGGVHQSITTLGFDPRQEKFVGTFVSSMMEFLWIYKGGLDTSLKKLTLDTEGPGPTGEGTRLVPYQDIYEFVNDDYRVLRSMSKGEDGKWKEFMLAHYRRKK
jgi:hypothetical protein